MHFSLVFSVSTLLLTTLVATTRAVESCYFPSGLEIVPSVNATYEPCNEQAGAISQCCPTNQGCSANGLCVDVDGQYSRGGCTDSTFGSPYCLDLCTTVLSGRSSDSEVPVHQCTDGTWCCGTSNTTTTCCANGLGTSLPITHGIDDGDRSEMSNTAKLAIGCAVGCAILVSIGAVGFVAWRKRQAKERETRERLEVLSPTRSEHGLLPFGRESAWDRTAKEETGEVTRPKAARLSGSLILGKEVTIP